MLLSGLLDTVKHSKYFIVWAKLQQQVCFEGTKSSNGSKFDSEAELERSLFDRKWQTGEASFKFLFDI